MPQLSVGDKVQWRGPRGAARQGYVLARAERGPRKWPVCLVAPCDGRKGEAWIPAIGVILLEKNPVRISLGKPIA